MPSDLLIGIDAGTSVIKAVAFEISGAQVALAAVPNEIVTTPDGGAEQDLHDTWQACTQVLRDLAEQIPGLADRTAALALTGHGDGTWLIDAAGEPVAPAWTWLDSRAGAVADDWRATDVGPRLQRLTGTAANLCLQSAQLATMQRAHPDVLEQAHTAFHCKDWLFFRCTGIRATDASEGGMTFGNYHTRDYEDEVFPLLGLEEVRHLLPPIADGPDRVAPMTTAAAAATGLEAGTPVVLAPMDAMATALGAGVYEPGRRVGVSILGSAGNHLRLYESPADVVLPEGQVGYTVPFVAPGTLVGFVSHMAASLNADWLVSIGRQIVADATGTDLPAHRVRDVLDSAAAAAPAGTVLFHPFISDNGERGPFVDPRARAGFQGLSAGTSPGSLMRAVYEGIGFASRDCYRAMGLQPEEIRLTGGAARSDTFRAIFAAAVAAPIRVLDRPETGASGAALTAALALGHYAAVADGVDEWVAPYLGDAEPVDAALAERYADLFEAYREGYRGLSGVWSALARPRRQEGPQ